MVTLAEIERETARRLGPFRVWGCASGTANTVVVLAVKSAIDLGGYTGLYLLRRGVKTDGTAVPGFVADDRVRMVKEYDPGTGELTVDRNYATPVVADEQVEAMHLHPEQELRPAVIAGLWRCYLEDRVEVGLSGIGAERNLTAALPWLTKRGQVRAVHAIAVGAGYLPSTILNWLPYEAGGSVWVALDPDPFPNQALVSVLRPVATRVNGLSAPGPPTPTDVATGGSLLADTVYRAATAVESVDGVSPASPVARVYTADDGTTTHAARLVVPQVTGARSYLIYLSTNTAPLRVATITEAQRLAGVTVTAQDTISATSPGAGLVDVRVAGSGAAAIQAANPSNDSDVLDVDLFYAAAAGHIEAWRYYPARLQPLTSAGIYATKKSAAATFESYALSTVPPTQQRLVPPLFAGIGR